MKILFTIDSLLNAGTERSILDLVTKFSSEIEVEVVYFYRRHNLRNEFLNAGVNLFFIDLRDKNNYILGIIRLYIYLRKHKPDVIVSSLMSASLISRVAGFIYGIPVVGTFVSDTYGIKKNISKNKFSLKKKLIFYFDYYTAKTCSYFISNSDSIKINYINVLKLNSFKISTIYRGRNSIDFKQWFPLNRNYFKFVCIGRLIETKGFVEVILASEILLKNNYQIFIDIYGDGPFHDQLVKLINDKGLSKYIILKGNHKEAWRYLYEADCFVFSSWLEGFSGALIEAMMLGIPIISSDIPMNLEAVSDKLTAMVYPVKRFEILANKMIDLIENYPEAIEMGKRARYEALERFDILQVARQYEDVLKFVLSNQKK